MWKKISENKVTLFDWLLFGIIAFFCYISMQQIDLLYTAGSSYSLLNGHILDYYDFNNERELFCGYQISTYVLFAIWNIPLYLSGMVTEPSVYTSYLAVMWYKLLPCLLYFGSAIVLYKLCVFCGFSKKKAQIAAFAFVTNPIGIYSQFCFGQYDIFTVFPILLGLLFYFSFKKGSLLVFSLLLGVACTFKYFAFLIFVPLLFLREKNILKLCGYCIVFFIPLSIVVLPFLGSASFVSNVLQFAETSYVFYTRIESFHAIFLVPILWVLLCLYSLLKDQLDDRTALVKWAIYISNIVFILIFVLSKWGPSWLLLGVPFWVLGLMINKRKDILCILDIMQMAFFVIMAANWGDKGLEVFQYIFGIFRGMVANRFDLCLSLNDIFAVNNIDLIFTCFCCTLCASAYMNHPRYCETDFSSDLNVSFNWFRTRFLIGISIYLIPMVICLFSLIHSPVLSYEGNQILVDNIGPLQDSVKVEQVFQPRTNTISAVTFKFETYNTINDFDCQLCIYEMDSGNELVRQDIKSIKLLDGKWNVVRFDCIGVDVGKQYVARLETLGADESNTVTLLRSQDNTSDVTHFARINGQGQNYDLAVKVYGDNV